MGNFLVSEMMRHVSSGVIARSKEYESRVTIVDIKPGTISAKVRGTYLYLVTINQRDNGEYLQRCTCAYTAPCKHSIAVSRVISATPTLKMYIEMESNKRVLPSKNPKNFLSYEDWDDENKKLPDPDTIIKREYVKPAPPNLITVLRAQITELQQPKPATKARNKERQIYYLINSYKKDNYHDPVQTLLTIEVGVAERIVGKEFWTYGDTRSAKTLFNANPQYLSPIDRKVLSIMITQGNAGFYGTHSWYSTVMDEFSAPEILKYLTGSPQVFCTNKNKRTLLTITSPGKLEIKLVEDEIGWRLIPQIDRDGVKQAIEIAEICDYAPNIVITKQNELVQLGNTVPVKLIKTLTEHAVIDKITADDPRTLETILMLQSLIPVELPDKLLARVQIGVPTPRLSAQALGTMYWPAKVNFAYGEHIVSAGDTAENYIATDDGILAKRDTLREQEFLHEYNELGKEIIAGPGELAEIASKLSSGWEIFIERERTTQLNRGKLEFNFDNTSGIDWLDIDGKVEVDQQQYSLAELILASQGGNQIIELGHGSQLLSDELYEQLKKLAPIADRRTGQIRLNRTQVGLLESLGGIVEEKKLHVAWVKTLKAVRNYMGIAKVEKVPNLVATLRPYQKHGISYLSYLEQTGFGGILADDMGLGKTVQTIGILQKYFNEHKSLHCLIVIPTSVTTNWENELGRFAPKLRVTKYTGLNRELPDKEEVEIILTTYVILRIDQEKLVKREFDYVILDEAQYAKNVASQTAKTVRELKAKNRLCLTGTPIENNLTELYAQMQFLNPGLFGTLEEFKHDIAIPIEKHEDAGKSTHLQRLIKPFILRRTKDQVLRELPTKTEQIITIEMSEPQRRYYDSIKSYYQAKVLKLVDQQGVGKSHLQILEALLRLRQVCCDPRLIKPTEKPMSTKLEETIELVSEAIAGGHKILLFSQFTSMIEILERAFGKHEIPYQTLTGSTPATQRAKLIEQFQTTQKPLVFLLSLKAGGIGVNLTGADYVIHYDPWWNPAVENQATDRAHRIGQTKAVTVYKLIMKDSIEEKILNLQAKKRDLIDKVIIGGKVSKKLTKEDLEYLLG